MLDRGTLAVRFCEASSNTCSLGKLLKGLAADTEVTFRNRVLRVSGPRADDINMFCVTGAAGARPSRVVSGQGEGTVTWTWLEYALCAPVASTAVVT